MQPISYEKLRVNYWVGDTEVTGNNTVGHFGGVAGTKPCPERILERTKDKVGMATLDNSITEVSEKGIRDDGQYPKRKPGQSEGFRKWEKLQQG